MNVTQFLLTDIVRGHAKRDRRSRLEREFEQSIAHLTPQRQQELREQRRRR